MKKHDQQIAIWTLLGWKKDVECEDENDQPCLAWRAPQDRSNIGWGESYLPDIDSLDVIHEAEELMPRGFRERFTNLLVQDDDESEEWNMAHANAAQRREALLKTLNLWTE